MTSGKEKAPNGSKDRETPELTTSQKLNLETARIGWVELQRVFAMDRLVIVDRGLDLVKIAADFVDDNHDLIEPLLQSGQVRRALTEDARRWQEAQPDFWAVVAAPWVLVQEGRESGSEA